MNHSELLESLIYTTHQGAGFILRRMGRIPPAAVYLAHPEDPLVDFYFPKEDDRRASDEELLARVREAMREVAARPETCGIAVATEIQRDPSTALGASGGRRFMALQAETRDEIVVLHYPIRKRWLGWAFGEPEEGDVAGVERFLKDGA